MNYTANHHLPQWVASDRVRMEDFNDAMSAIESGLDGAVSKADAAFSPDNLPYYVGSYTGTGDENQKVEVPFRPSLVIVSGMTESSSADSTEFIRYFACTGNNANVRRRIQIVNGGFMVYPPINYGYRTPSLNEPNRHYDFIAFR